MVTRLGLLFSLAWIMKLTDPLVTVADRGISGRDMILLSGGLFLLWKSVHEIHNSLEGAEHETAAVVAVGASFVGVLAQIAVIDIIFSLDSVITAVGMVDDIAIDEARMKAAAGAGFTTATDLADWLVRELGMPFREAHHATGRIVRMAEEKGCDISELALADMKLVEARIDKTVFSVLGVENSVASRRSFGGTAPANVKKAVAAARRRFM
jgi:hypothetical protein